MCVFETHQKVVCLDLLDGNAKAIKAGWTCKCIPRRMRCLSGAAGCARTDHRGEAGRGLAYVSRDASEIGFVSTCWMGTQRRSRRDGLANVFRDASESGLSRPAGWEPMGDQGGMDLQMYSETHQKLVLSRPAGWEPMDDQGGMGACICLETHQKLVSAGCEGTSNHSN